MVTKRDPVETDLFYHLRELDAERALEALRDEEEEETLEDQEQKALLALIYAEDHETTVPTLPFREWARERLADERTPAYTEAWKEKPSNVEYWNWNDDWI